TRDQPKNYAESQFGFELALVDKTNPQFDEVVAVPPRFLEPGASVQHPNLPFRVTTKQFFPNSALLTPAVFQSLRGTTAQVPPSAATAGDGPQIVAVSQSLTYKPDERNVPSAFVELIGAEGSLGTWLVSQAGIQVDPNPRARQRRFLPQTVNHAGRTWEIELRPARAYKPFTLTLLKFSHDKYAGTDTPKNFSSKIQLTTPDGRDDREVDISMNNPLRHDGLTFYQASYDPEDPDVTILQVVRNPSWLMPYVSCALMTLGLLWQFGFHLFGFVQKRRSVRPALA
ncbi:MAG: cytochrome c biogenesis protein ResB, partial [Opitutaceae bacterium]